MAPLPKSRLPQSHTRLTAFESVGLDHLGVLHVKAHNGDILKRYLLLVVCMRTRAVHIEITWEKSAPSTIMALTPFQARYGTPMVINTDNALNFVRTEKDFNKIPSAFDGKNISWIFNPPKAAWFGGHFEAFVQMVKNSIFKAHSGSQGLL